MQIADAEGVVREWLMCQPSDFARDLVRCVREAALSQRTSRGYAELVCQPGLFTRPVVSSQLPVRIGRK